MDTSTQLCSFDLMRVHISFHMMSVYVNLPSVEILSESIEQDLQMTQMSYGGLRGTDPTVYGFKPTR